MQLATGLRLQLDPARPDVIAVVGGGGKSSIVFRTARDLARNGLRAVITHTARIAAFQSEWAPAVVEVLGDELPLAALAEALAAHNVCLLTGPVVGDRRAGLPPTLVDALAAHAPQLGVAAITVEADGSKMRPAKAPAAHEPVLPDATTVLAPVLGLDAVGAPIDGRLFHRAELVRQVLGLPPDENVLRLTPQAAANLLIHPLGGAKALGRSMRLLPLFNKADTPLRLLHGRLAARSLAQRGQAALLTAAGMGTEEQAVGSPGEPVVERWGEMAVVVLAAGAAARFGRPKQLAEVNGSTMLSTALAAAATLPGPIFVVIGAHHELVQAHLTDLPARLARQLAGRLHLVHNPRWAEGQATSLHAAIRRLPPAVEAAIWMPVDQPFLNPVLLAALVAAWRRGADLAAPAVDGELRGAPALFDRSFWPQLAAVQGDRGGRGILQRHAAQVAQIPTQRECLQDIDHPQDLT